MKKRSACILPLEGKFGTTILELNSVHILLNLKMSMLYNPENLLINPGGTQSYVCNNTCKDVAAVAQDKMAQRWKQPHCQQVEGVNKRIRL
jgi:hypothetical protein